MNFICILCVHTWNASVFLCLLTLQWNVCSNIAKQTKMLHLLNNKKNTPFESTLGQIDQESELSYECPTK